MTWCTQQAGGPFRRRFRGLALVGSILIVLLGLLAACGCSTPPEEDPAPLSAAAVRAPDRAGGDTRSATPGSRTDSRAAVRSADEPLGRAVISPRVPRAGDTLTVRLEPEDLGRVPFFAYRWSVNGEEVPGERRDTFAGGFRRGDQVSVFVHHGDGAGSDGVLIDSVRVGNAPPYVEELETPRFEDGAYRTRIAAADPDGDRLVFSVVEGPPGLAVGPDGDVTWVPGEDGFGRHEVSISIRDDAGGDVVYTYAFSVERQ